MCYLKEREERGKQKCEELKLENYPSWKNIPDFHSLPIWISYNCSRRIDSATISYRERGVKWKAGNLKICRRRTKGRNVARTKDWRERGKGWREERKKEKEGEGGKGVHASKLSRAIIPSWRVQRQRERTLPGIKVLQTCGKCSWGRVGRPRSNQTNRGTYRP